MPLKGTTIGKGKLNIGTRIGRIKKRIVLTTFGSLGDLHPYIAIALGLQDRGHEAVIATSEMYREKITALGIAFRPVRPDRAVIDAAPQLLKRVLDLRTGPETLIREIMMPFLAATFEDLMLATEGADLLVSHCLTYATRIVAEKRGVPWVSPSLLQCASFPFSIRPFWPRRRTFPGFDFLDPGCTGRCSFSCGGS